MNILIDYNNISNIDQNRGPEYVIDKIISKLDNLLIGNHTRLQFRLYDGWYENQSPTRKAQFVSSEILARFPKMVTLSSGPITSRMVVNAELAYSLLVEPGKHLMHTFRRRGYPHDLTCADPVGAGCTFSSCQLAETHTFIKKQVCPNSGCGMRPEDILGRSEQKLVDTMLAVDLLCLKLQGEKVAAIVSSDDDMWPSIRTALSLGMKILHVQTKNRNTPAFYTRGLRFPYTEIIL
jgi:uncharacterized LabA/DUF88 family protein